MQLFPEELALANFKGELLEGERGYMRPEEAYEWLKEMSNEDFGQDIDAWTKWVKRTVANHFSEGKSETID